MEDGPCQGRRTFDSEVRRASGISTREEAEFIAQRLSCDGFRRITISHGPPFQVVAYRGDLEGIVGADSLGTAERLDA